MNTDKITEGIKNYKPAMDDFKKIISDRGVGNVTVCLTCGEFFVGSTDDHVTKTKHTTYCQGKTFICTQCNYNFPAEENDNLKKIGEKITKAVSERFKDQAVQGVKDKLGSLLGI